MADSDFGIKVSQPGFNVKSAGDPNFYFSSSWPWLKVALTDQTTFNAAGKVVISHDLKYPAFALGYSSVDGPRIATADDSSNIFSGTAGATLRYYIYRLPLNVPFQSSQQHVTPVGQQTINRDFGFKFAKRGKDVTSSDLRDYTIHSGTRSPLVHKVIYEPLAPIATGDYNGIFGLEWQNELPYFPIYFAYAVNNGVFTPLDSVTTLTPKINYDGLGTAFIRGIVINDLGRSSQFGCFVILKDPLDATASAKTVVF